jgi:hypothetical protein
MPFKQAAEHEQSAASVTTRLAMASRSLLLACVAAAAPVAAYGQGNFDGTWNVAVLCARSPDGALPYTWSFTAQVSGGMLLGHYKAPGTVPSGTLSGQISASGQALLTMRGLTGKPDYSIDRVQSGSMFAYTVTAQFTARSGSGKRNEMRDCTLNFNRF